MPRSKIALKNRTALAQKQRQGTEQVIDDDDHGLQYIQYIQYQCVNMMMPPYRGVKILLYRQPF